MSSKIEEYVTEIDYTAYAIHTILNRLLNEDAKTSIRPQMMYNYARNGLIVKGKKIHGAELRKFTKIEVIDFLSRYCIRNNVNISNAESVSKDQLILDLESVTE